MIYNKIDELVKTYSIISEIIRKFDENQLNTSTSMCKHSLAQIIYHYAYYESLYVTKMFRLLLYGNDLFIKSFFDIDLSTLYFTIDEVNKWLYCFQEERKNNIIILDSFYSIMSQNKFEHEVHGELGIDDILEKILIHDKHHNQQIQCIALLLSEV